MEQLLGRCSFEDQSFVLFIGRDADLASIHSRVSQRLGVNMQENILKYRLPMDTDVEQVLLDDGDVQAMFDLHKCQGTSFINLQIHAVETRCLSTHASRQSGDRQPLDRSTSNTQGGSLETTEPIQLPRSSLELYDRGQGAESVVPVLTQYSVSRIHSVGQVFISKELLQMELTNYAIARGFNWKYLKNDSVRLTVRCNVSVCPWRLHASVIRGGPQFAIKSLNNKHTCGCDIMSDGHPRTSKKWVGNVVKGKLVDKPTYRASEMMSDIRQEYGICIPYHQTYAVDLHLQTCSCGHWQLVKIPCKHACAAIGSNKEAVTQYVSAFYSTDVYRAAYERNIQPIPTFDMSDPPQPSEVLIKPPTTKRLPRRPRKRRIHSRGEVDHAYICSRCKQI
ncbi:hypothetical protein Taro_042962, partial [Colocasia esculenta]|nr:hypothetical protein [Colocasia esculenta]